MSESKNNKQTSQKRTLRKQSVSQRKIEANRRNSLRSTGPKTERGKRVVARNAIKHGLLAREVVICAGDGREASEEFQALLKDLVGHYGPIGPEEGLLVQTIATCWWRKARVIRAENGEIRDRLDTLALDRALQDIDKGNLEAILTASEFGIVGDEIRADHQVSSSERWAVLQKRQRDLRSRQSGLAYLRALLGSAKAQILEGYLSPEIRKQIAMAFGLWDPCFANSCILETYPETPPDKGIAPDCQDEEPAKKYADVIKLIDDRVRDLQIFQEWAIEREKMTLDAEKRKLSLPSTEAIDKLIRYERHLEVQLSRATDQLERLQRRRIGDAVPPPLTVNVGIRGR